jgi:hypothetical protein
MREKSKWGPPGRLVIGRRRDYCGRAVRLIQAWPIARPAALYQRLTEISTRQLHRAGRGSNAEGPGHTIDANFRRRVARSDAGDIATAANLYFFANQTSFRANAKDFSQTHESAIVKIIRPSRTGIIFAHQDDNLLPVRRSKASTYFALVFSIISGGK